MKTFKLEGTIIFEAKDLADACAKLSQYFLAIKNGKEPRLGTMPGTDIHIKPVDETL